MRLWTPSSRSAKYHAAATPRRHRRVPGASRPCSAEGSGRLVDPEGRVRAGRGSARRPPAGSSLRPGSVPEGESVALARLRQRSGKIVGAFAVEGACDPQMIRRNTFVMK